jgi:hypothetical protein
VSLLYEKFATPPLLPRGRNRPVSIKGKNLKKEKRKMGKMSKKKEERARKKEGKIKL